MTIILFLTKGNGIKSGFTLRDLTEEGWVRFNDIDLDLELDTNQLHDIEREAIKRSCMAGRKPTSGPLFERMNLEEYIASRKR